MSCANTQAVLTGEAPFVAVDAHLAGCVACGSLSRELADIDRAALDLPLLEVPVPLRDDTLELLELLALSVDLPELQPPADLLAATLAAVELERAPPAEPAETPRPAPRKLRKPWARRAGMGMLAAAAVAAFVVSTPTEGPADPDTLVERGSGVRAPEVALKIAVDDGDGMARLSRARSYDAGDTLYFRAQVDQPAWVTLVRVDVRGAVVIHSESLEPGERDLQLQGGPLAWRIEPGEHSATYALLATPEPLAALELQAALGALGPDDDVCLAAASVGARCAASPVTVAEAPSQGGSP